MENNKLIAEFMGIDKEILSTADIHSWSDAPHFYITENCKEKVMKGIIKYSKYHTSWDWLMPVVEKIESFIFDENNSYNVTIGSTNYCIIQDSNGDSIEIIKDNGETKLYTVYQAVVEFIKTYNDGR